MNKIALISFCFVFITSGRLFGQSGTIENPIIMADNDNKLATDTFTNDGIKFRYSIILDSDNQMETGNKVTVEKLTNGKWIHCLSYDYSNRTRKVIKDINLDGFLDIMNDWKWYSQVFLYDKTKKQFDTSETGISNDWAIVDSSRKIFCAYDEVKGNQEDSYLYIFDSLEIKVLFSVEFTTEIDDDGFSRISGFTLYKGKRKISHTTLIKKAAIFDYVKYWKSKYKALLNFH